MTTTPNFGRFWSLGRLHLTPSPSNMENHVLQPWALAQEMWLEWVGPLKPQIPEVPSPRLQENIRISFVPIEATTPQGRPHYWFPSFLETATGYLIVRGRDYMIIYIFQRDFMNFWTSRLKCPCLYLMRHSFGCPSSLAAFVSENLLKLWRSFTHWRNGNVTWSLQQGFQKKAKSGYPKFRDIYCVQGCVGCNNCIVRTCLDKTRGTKGIHHQHSASRLKVVTNAPDLMLRCTAGWQMVCSSWTSFILGSMIHCTLACTSLESLPIRA